MSFVAYLVTACVAPSIDLSHLRSTDDLGGLALDESLSIVVFSRNGWLNDRLEEIAACGPIASIPTRQAPAVVCSGARLETFIAELNGFLQSLRHDRTRLPAEALAHADDVAVERGLAEAPGSLEAARRGLDAARARGEDGEHAETLLGLLWCQLRLAEHAKAHGLRYFCVRSL